MPAGWNNPATIDAEIGANDLRLSDMGTDFNYGVQWTDVAYSPAQNEYFVVWHGDDNGPGLADGEYEIFGQRVDGSTGDLIGDYVRLSDMGPDGSTGYRAEYPAVAYSSVEDQYFVVWQGDDNTGALISGETEVWGQRVEAASGAEIGADVRLSDMGADGEYTIGFPLPKVAYSAAQNEYLVVWAGSDDAAGLGTNEFEILAQRVDAETGAEVGANDFRLSDMGPDGNPNYDTFDTALAFAPAANAHLAIWQGDDEGRGLVDGEYEIFGQRVTTALTLYLPIIKR